MLNLLSSQIRKVVLILSAGQSGGETKSRVAMQSFCNVNPSLTLLSVELAARQRWTRKIFTICQSLVSEEESE